jgi:hypothetical protein
MAECFIEHPTYGRVPMNWWLPMYRRTDDGIEYTSKFEIAFDGHGRATLRSPHRPAASFPVGFRHIEIGDEKHAPAHLLLTSAFPYVRPTDIVKYIDGDINNMSITNLRWHEKPEIAASDNAACPASCDTLVHPYGPVATGPGECIIPLYGLWGPIPYYGISFARDGRATLRCPTFPWKRTLNGADILIHGARHAADVLMLSSAFTHVRRTSAVVEYIDGDTSNLSILNLRWRDPLAGEIVWRPLLNAETDNCPLSSTCARGSRGTACPPS